MQELVAPILKAVSVQWERAFLSGLQATLDKLQTCVSEELNAFSPALLADLAAAAVPSSATGGIGVSGCDGMLSALRGTVADVKEAAQKQQRELSRSLEPLVQEKMRPGYQQATAESGTGSHRRRVALLETHVRTSAPKMFNAAGGEIIEQLKQLREGMGARLEKDVVDSSLKSLRTSFAPLWEEVSDEMLQARRSLVPKCKDILIEANNAVRRLEAPAPRGGGAASSEGGAAGGGSASLDDDDEVADVTEERRAAKRKMQEEEAIDLSDSENVHPEFAAASTREHAPPAKQVKVKSEVKPEFKVEA